MVATFFVSVIVFALLIIGFVVVLLIEIQ